MAKEKKRNKGCKKRKIRRKFRKLFVSTAAFITAAVVVVFCIRYIYTETDYFKVKAVEVSGNNIYTRDYIKAKSQIEGGERIFSVDRNRVKEIIEDEVYIKDVRVIYKLPDKVLIELTEREEKYQILHNNEYIVTDKEGFVLRTGSEKNELITIESLEDVLYNVGETIQITGIEDVNSIFDTVDYINDEFGTETVKGLYIDSDNSFLLETEYGTYIRIRLDEDIKYQIVFAMKIINERLNNNLIVVNGLIDFTKGDSPVYAEDFKREEFNE